MEKQETRIIFTHDGVYIRLSNGEGNKKPFTYKEEAIEALYNYADEGKISQKELLFFMREIAVTTNLPWKYEDSEKIIKEFAFVKFPEEIINPYFEICKCDNNITHVHLKNGNGKIITGEIHSKDRGREYIDFFLEIGKIRKEVYTYLIKQLDKLKLPKMSFYSSVN